MLLNRSKKNPRLKFNPECYNYYLFHPPVICLCVIKNKKSLIYM